MTHDEIKMTARTMALFGGSFVSAIGTALQRADEVNERRLMDAFPDLVKRYGPGSDPYRWTALRWTA